MADTIERVAWNNLKLLRQEYDALLRKYGRRIPRSEEELRAFAQELSNIVNMRTRASGFVPPKYKILGANKYTDRKPGAVRRRT